MEVGPESSASAAGLEVDETPLTVNVAAAFVEASAAAERATRALRRRQPQKERITRAEVNRFGLYRVAIKSMERSIESNKRKDEACLEKMLGERRSTSGGSLLLLIMI